MRRSRVLRVCLRACLRAVLVRAVLVGAVLVGAVLVGAVLGPPAVGLASTFGSITSGSAPQAAVWGWPVEPPHRVVAEFHGPQTPYSAGHRGVDMIAAAGDPVLAVQDGVVAFARVVVDRPVLTLTHEGNVLSSVEPVLALVSPGDRVVRGQRIGTVAEGGHCAGCLHLGVRVAGRYVSPLVFLGGVQRAVLLPLPG